MHRSTNQAYLVVAFGFLLVQCAGRVAADQPNRETDAAPSDSGDSGDNGDADSGACETLVPCGGSGNIDPSTGVHTACGTDVSVNRSGKPVSICHNIK